MTRLRDGMLEADGLTRWAVERWGAPVSCEGAVSGEFDGTSFGTLRLGFPGGATLEVQTAPPETSVVTLRRSDGLGGEADMRALLADYADRIGTHVDWSAPTESVDGAERVLTFQDPDPGLNAFASLIFRGATVVGLRVSLAL